jgi:hypothetical protein
MSSKALLINVRWLFVAIAVIALLKYVLVLVSVENYANHKVAANSVAAHTLRLPSTVSVQADLASLRYTRKAFKVYVYNWSRDIVDRWPNKYSHKRLSIDKHFALNHGAGPLVNWNHSLYHTHQYSLFRLFFHRLLNSDVLTLNPEEATVFFVPYDIGLDSTTRQSDGALTATNCPKRADAWAMLQSSPFFRRSNGTDHFLLHSINHMMLFFLNNHCREWYRTCINCIKFSIDVYDASLFSILHRLPEMTSRWFSVPFPSNYHWKQEQSVPAIGQYPRQTAVSFVGSIDVTAQKQRLLRIEIVKQCTMRPTDCVVQSLSSHSSNAQVVMDTYLQSVFCLSPGGDFPTRKGFLDAMLSGCIPVTFELEAAQYQWRYHWGSTSTAVDCTIYIPRDKFMRAPKETIDKLVALSKNYTFVMEKLQCIERISHRFQYRISGLKMQRDAFDLAMDLLADIVS